MVRRAVLSVAVALAALAGLPAAGPTAYPPPKTLGPVDAYGANIQRAMTLLATSTATKRNTVRILFYGQSITDDDWTRQVTEHLKRRYPLTDIVAENRAIGGFHAARLVRTAEADLYPFYPDLVIFHVYGSAEEYENIIRRLRERTTADILHATDHVAPLVGERMDEETDPARLATPGPGAHDAAWRRAVFLPAVTKKYDLELADVRGLWKQYLVDHGLKPSALLCDDLHLNAHGNHLMGQFILAHLQYRPELPTAGWEDRVRTFEVGTDVHWEGGKLVLPFDGNRVDLVCKERADPAPPAAVRIDGKKPSEFPELYTPTRTRLSTRSEHPPLFRVRHEKPLVVEDWRLVVTGMNPDRTRFQFKVIGSVTGEDGEGDTDRAFVSKSGRVAFDPDDVYLAHTLRYSRDPNAAAVEVRWSVVPLFADEFAVPPRPNPFGETVVTVAQGLPNGRHTLEVAGGPDTPIAAVRVYRPPLGR